MKTFTYHTDPGHGWLEVSVAEAAEVGLTPADFSGYSYRRGNTLFLEEDLDAARFAEAYAAAHGGERMHAAERFVDREHWIRALPDMHA